MKERLKNFFKSKAFRLSLLVIGIYAVIAAAFTVFFDGRHIRFYMQDSDNITVECGSEYLDPGIYAVTVGRLFGESEQHLSIKTEGEVDTDKLGTYTLRYTVNWFFREYSTQRTVNVVDTTPPVIELEFIEGYKPSWIDGYEEEGFTAHDLCDGDLTDKVTRELSGSNIIYSVSDSSGNTCSIERQPSYSITEPVITLMGSDSMSISARMQYTDPGFSAKDSLGNDLSSYVVVEGSVQPYTVGEYQLKYSITNQLGQSVEKVRTVTVYPADSSSTVTPDEKTIYLTFDDGPGPYTDWLLNILDYYDVKATFFVTALNPDYEDCIGRAFREGHAIGVHSATHNYYSIYSSEEAFFQDFNAVEEMIYRQTGQYTGICRFPGGSSNTVSSFNPGIMSRLSVSLGDMGYKYFDWNVSSGDAGETTEADEVAANIISGIYGKQYAVVLQHDIKDYSVEAVEQVIVWGRNNGYVFRPLDETSPGAHHGIAN